jgi:Methyltransferase domain
MRVLDLGSGIGDVALLVGDIVGPCGRVLGLDRDAMALDRARQRIVEQGCSSWVSFQTTNLDDFCTTDQSWGSGFKGSGNELALYAKRCDHNGYEPAKAVCAYLMEHGATEFSGNNAQNAAFVAFVACDVRARDALAQTYRRTAQIHTKMLEVRMRVSLQLNPISRGRQATQMVREPHHGATDGQRNVRPIPRGAPHADAVCW